MSGTRIFFIAFALVIALVGLLAAGAAQDFGMTIFGFGLIGFGLLFSFSLIKRHYDELDAAQARARR